MKQYRSCPFPTSNLQFQHLCFSVCVCVLFMCVHAFVCVQMWRPEVGTENHPQPLFYVIHRGRLSQSNPELADVVSLINQLPLGIFCSAFWVWAATPAWHFMWVWKTKTLFLTLWGKNFSLPSPTVWKASEFPGSATFFIWFWFLPKMFYFTF